jgi:chromosome segregation ATPase
MTKTTKASKRTAEAGLHGKAAKAAKVSPAVQAVIDVIRGADDLNSGCKQMLLAMLPASLSIAKDVRTAQQERVVEMIGQLVDSKRQSLQEAAEVEASKCVEVEASKANLDAAVTGAEELLLQATELFTSAQAAAQEAQQASKDAALSLKEAKGADVSADDTCSKLKADRTQLQEVLDAHLSALCAEDFQAETAAGHRDAIMTCITSATTAEAFESALLVTLPEALGKPPTERGEFDKMAIDALKKNLSNFLEGLSSKTEAANLSKAQCTAAIEAAEAQVSSTQEIELAKATAVGETEEKMKAASTALETAKNERKQFEPTLASATHERDSKQETLKRFEELNATSFKALQMATTMDEAHKMGA